MQHDFGHVDVRFLTGTEQRVHFFASRLKYSRWVEVTIVPDERAETLVRTFVDHFAAIGGVPLLAVFDRPKTVALTWTRDGHVTEWNPLFAGVALDLSVGIEVCWPASPWQKGSVENLVGWVKGSFFKQRRFVDDEDLLTQLVEWRTEANRQRPCRATNSTASGTSFQASWRRRSQGYDRVLNGRQRTLHVISRDIFRVGELPKTPPDVSSADVCRPHQRQRRHALSGERFNSRTARVARIRQPARERERDDTSTVPPSLNGGAVTLPSNCTLPSAPSDVSLPSA